jgi:hypothetical protein
MPLNGGRSSHATFPELSYKPTDQQIVIATSSLKDNGINDM